MRTNFNKYRTYRKKDIFEDHNTLRFFLALHFGDVIDKETLMSKYNITSAQIVKISQKLQELGYIYTDTFNNLDENTQLSLLNGSLANAHDIYEKSHKIQVYVISPTGKEKGKEILKKKLQESQDNQSLHYLIKQISEYTKNYRQKIRKIDEIESILLPRHLEFPTKSGKLLIERPSFAQSERRKQIAQASKQIQTGTDLVAQEDIKKIIHAPVPYVSKIPEFEKYMGMSKDEILSQVEEDFKHDSIEINKYIKNSRDKRFDFSSSDLNEAMKEDSMYFIHKGSNWRRDYDSEMYTRRESEDFLDNLGKPLEEVKKSQQELDYEQEVKRIEKEKKDKLETQKQNYLKHLEIRGRL